MTTAQTRSMSDVVEHYVDRRGKSGAPVSTRQATATLRMLMPDCPLTDREIGNLIAAAAVRKGCCVVFDGDAGG